MKKVFFVYYDYYIVRLFNERNAAKKEQEHQRVAKKNLDTELRHEKNIERLNEENEKIEKENEILIEYVQEVKNCTIEKAIQHYIKTSVYAMLQDEKTQLYTKTEKELKAMLWKELKGERYV